MKKIIAPLAPLALCLISLNSHAELRRVPAKTPIEKMSIFANPVSGNCYSYYVDGYRMTFSMVDCRDFGVNMEELLREHIKTKRDRVLEEIQEKESYIKQMLAERDELEKKL